MLVDATFRYALRNFSTLFLFIAVVIAPLHIAHAFVFRSVYQLGDIDLARAVDVGVLDAARLEALWISAAAIAAIEVGLLPLLARGTRRVIARDDAGEVPRVIDALAGMFGGSERPVRPSGGRAAAAVAAVVVGDRKSVV